jgi:hypothetical protein
MIVRVVRSRTGDLPEVLRDGIRYATGDPVYPLRIGQQYVVYAVVVAPEYPSARYCVCDDDYPVVRYPMLYPAPLFEVVDSRISKCWEYGFDWSAQGLVVAQDIVLAFPEWVNDPSFYSRLWDGEKEAVKTFVRYKKRIDSEAS